MRRLYRRLYLSHLIIILLQVASRAIMVAAALILIFLGLFSKFGAVLSTIPEPITGSQFAVSMAIIGGVGMSNMQLVDATNSRNMTILGMALMAGIAIPQYATDNPIYTGIVIPNIVNIQLSNNKYIIIVSLFQALQHWINCCRF